MAKKSKTQRAKASARRAAKKEERAQQEAAPVKEAEQPKQRRFSLPTKKQDEQPNLQDYQKPAKTSDKPKKKNAVVRFFSEVRSEMRRVTWPTRQDVLQWSGVVIVALLFFGVFCVVLDDWVVTPILMAISGLGA